MNARTNSDERYFSDVYQALPLRGYTRMFENMILHEQKNITVRCNADYFVKKQQGKLPQYKFLVYTGPIDSYFSENDLLKLEYRSIVFQETFIDNPQDERTAHLEEVNASTETEDKDSVLSSLNPREMMAKINFFKKQW